MPSAAKSSSCRTSVPTSATTRNGLPSCKTRFRHHRGFSAPALTFAPFHRVRSTARLLFTSPLLLLCNQVLTALAAPTPKISPKSVHPPYPSSVDLPVKPCIGGAHIARRPSPPPPPRQTSFTLALAGVHFLQVSPCPTHSTPVTVVIGGALCAASPWLSDD